MSNQIECATCGYPLTPEERTTLVEVNGKMRKPWVELTDEERGQAINANFGTGLWAMAKDIEAKLKEKNT